jgi:membrane-associated phospholipid phosphatase
MHMKKVVVALAVCSASVAANSVARAQTAPAASGSVAVPTAVPPPVSTPTSGRVPSAIQAPDDPRRKSALTPAPVQTSVSDQTIRFEADPIGDGALLGATIGFAGTLELVLSTGEIRPQQIDPNFNTSNLLGIDRGAISQHIDPHAATYSTIGLAGAVAFAALDPVLTGFRDGSEAAIVDAFMYAEAASMAWGLSDIAKVAVRRPRPIAYINRAAYISAGGNPATYDNTSTDSSLSFFSGHAAVTSSISAAATYLAFARSPGTARPWITLFAGSMLTAFVSIERVRAGAHFPTDVLAGAFGGAGVGLVVVHFHREDTVQQRPVWVGMTPAPGGGMFSLGGRF